MIKVIKKTDVIKALKAEKLKRGNWFHFSSIEEEEQPKKGCPVCAVGAVLRHVSFETWARKNNYTLNDLGQKAVNFDEHGVNVSGANSHQNIKRNLEIKNYLGALSVYFESGHSKTQCIIFVKKHFPKSFKLNIKF